jgi:hypothetical protein
MIILIIVKQLNHLKLMASKLTGQTVNIVISIEEAQALVDYLAANDLPIASIRFPVRLHNARHIINREMIHTGDAKAVLTDINPFNPIA